MFPILSRTLADPFEQLQRRIDCACNLGWILSDSETTATYPVDIREDGDSVTVEAELPGFKKDQIQVKGIAHPVQTYEVRNLYSALNEEGRTIEEQRKGFALSLDLDQVDDSEEVRATLQAALERLELEQA